MKDNALYLEADEDITSAIDKLGKSAGDSVQIVVPKRSTMLQSIINLKLLKKAAQSHGKELVLVTNDRIASDLAGRVGLAVAPSIGAKPVIADAEIPAELKSNEEIIEADDPEPPRQPEPATAPKPSSSKRPLLRHREITDEPAVPAAPSIPPVPADDTETAPAAAVKPPKVPNFKRLQRRLLWVGALVVLVLGYLLAMYLFTSAKVTLYANGSKIDIDTSFAADPNLKTTDQTKAVLAAQAVTVSKDLTGPFTPSGKKDAGTKASGTVTIQNCEDSNVYPLAQGNTLAAQGLNFITDAAVTIPAGTFSNGGKTCTSPTVSVAVVAAQNGDNYNVTNASFTSTKLTANFKVTGSMSGGTTKTVTVVTQSDVDTGKAALLDKDKDNATRDLQGRVPSGYAELPASQTTAVGSVSPAPAVDAEGSTGSVTVHVTYTVLAIKQSEYQALVRAQETKQIGSQNQIYDDGIGSAQVTAAPADSTGRQNFHFTTEAFGGPKLDTATIAKQLAGKRYGDAADAATRTPGVTRADISVWPGWATSLPSRPGKIKIVIQVANNK
jgi:hypothetical protein